MQTWKKISKPHITTLCEGKPWWIVHMDSPHKESIMQKAMSWPHHTMDRTHFGELSHSSAINISLLWDLLWSSNIHGLNVPQWRWDDPSASTCWSLPGPRLGWHLITWYGGHYCSCSVLTHLGRGKMAATSADNTFKYKFIIENVLISMKISLKFFPKV